MQLKTVLNAAAIAVLLEILTKNTIGIENIDADVTAAVIQIVIQTLNAADHKHILPDLFIKKLWQILFIFHLTVYNLELTV